MQPYIRYAELKSLGIPFSRTHLKRLIEAGRFPRPVKLGASTIAWLREDIRAYDARIRQERDARDAKVRQSTGAGGANAQTA